MLYKTWHLAIMDKFNLLNGTIPLILRDGTQYLIRARLNDIGKISSIYIRKEYDRYIDKIRDNAIVIDIGAHIGVFSIYAQRLAKNVIVYSYEPFDESFGLLQNNIRINKLERGIYAFNIGVGARRGIRKLFIDRRNLGGNSMFYETEEYVQIDTVSLKDVFDENNIKICDFLKMDCEGAEYEILFNTPREYIDRIMSITMEYHDNGDWNELKRFLTVNEFEVILKEGDHLLYASRGCHS